MPLTSPAYPIGPYRFFHREFLIITYRTDPQKLRELVPEPLKIDEPLVKFEFIRMPDSTGFGDYTRERAGHPGVVRRPQGRLHPLHVPRRPSADRGRPRAVGLSQEARQADAARRDRHAGRHARLRPAADRLPAPWATSTSRPTSPPSRRRLLGPNFLLKIMPHVDGTPRICELVEYRLTDVDLKGAWTGPAH